MHAHTYCRFLLNLMGVSSILRYRDSERDAFISSAVFCNLPDTATSACVTAVLHRPAPNVSLSSVVVLSTLTALPHTLVRNASRFGPRDVPLIPGDFGTMIASQSEHTHWWHTWVTTVVFGISGMSIICLAVVRASERLVPPHPPHLSGLWCTASFDLRRWEMPVWSGLQPGTPTVFPSACPDGLAPFAERAFFCCAGTLPWDGGEWAFS